MAFSIERLTPYRTAPTTIGTLIARQRQIGDCEVVLVETNGPRVLMASRSQDGDCLDRAVTFATEWAAAHGIERVYVEGGDYDG